MRDERILSIVFPLTGHVQKDIETRKIGIAANDRLDLLFLYLYQFMDGGQKFL